MTTLTTFVVTFGVGDGPTRRWRVSATDHKHAARLVAAGLGRKRLPAGSRIDSEEWLAKTKGAK